MNRFEAKLKETGCSLTVSDKVQTFMINIGLTCNLSCEHCHVESSPLRKEQMSLETLKDCLKVIDEVKPEVVDITGGAPEMHEHFDWLLDQLYLREQACTVRTNLTILDTPKFSHLIQKFSSYGVTLVASLPCYSQENVDKQRGDRVFEKSIKVLKELNEVGYGSKDSCQLHLVYNPGGPSLPGAQTALEKAYKEQLKSQFGIVFNQLFTITNMVIGRFEEDLQQQNKKESYETLLEESFNASTVDGLMCRNQIHVSWDGKLYDCDFNYALELQVEDKQHIGNFDIDTFRTRRIETANHCFACTAGSGSSCTGSLS